VRRRLAESRPDRECGGTRLERLDCSSRGRQRCRNALIELGMRGWWRRVGSNHRQHDYESCALPLSYAARAQSEVSAPLVLSPWSCASWHGACRSPRASACSTGTPLGIHGTSLPSRLLGMIKGGCGGRIRTDDLRLMSPLVNPAVLGHRRLLPGNHTWLRTPTQPASGWSPSASLALIP
jgi:hypothetical protein